MFAFCHIGGCVGWWVGCRWVCEQGHSQRGVQTGVGKAKKKREREGKRGKIERKKEVKK